MPIYSFRCEDCDTDFEVRASIKEKENGLKPECPECHGQNIRQVITAGLLMHEDSKTVRYASGTGCGPNAKPGCCG